VPAKWSETENVRWKSAVHDKGWSSPVVAGDQVWVTTGKADGTALYAVGLDRKTGKVLHDLKLFTPANPPDLSRFNSHASPTPCLDGGKVYAHFGSYGTACVDAATGQTLWSRDDLPCDHWRGPAASPVVRGDRLFLVFDGYNVQYVVALNKATGKTIWRKDRVLPYPDNGDLKKAFATPAVFTVGGREMVVAPAAVGTIAYDAATGDEVWRVIHGGMNEAARPVMANGLIYLTSGHTQNLIAVRAGLTGDLTESGVAWQYKKEVPSKPSVCVVGDLLFLVNDKGIASCLEAATGKLVKSERLQGTFSASPVVAGGRVYFVSERGPTFVMSADRKFELLETNRLEGGCMASPAVVDGALFLRTATHLYCLGAGPK
jgi:outer membrane protein assembly factor BamB